LEAAAVEPAASLLHNTFEPTRGNSNGGQEKPGWIERARIALPDDLEFESIPTERTCQICWRPTLSHFDQQFLRLFVGFLLYTLIPIMEASFRKPAMRAKT